MKHGAGSAADLRTTMDGTVGHGGEEIPSGSTGEPVGEIVLAIFMMFGLLGIVLLAVGIVTKRRWATHTGITCLLSLAAAWTLGLYALLGGILVGTVVWFLCPDSKPL